MLLIVIGLALTIPIVIFGVFSGEEETDLMYCLG
jgi:hypothetical protein